MRILHYFLGFPPYRTGGLTKYCFDLMQTQAEDKNNVIALWPGRMSFFLNGKTKIKKRKNVHNIENYEIINPLPVPLDEGIKDVETYSKSNIIIFILKKDSINKKNPPIVVAYDFVDD